MSKLSSVSVDKVVNDITSGKARVHIPINGQPETLNGINQIGYALLRDALYEMTPWEIGFAGNMVSMNSVSEKRRSVIKRLAIKYLGIDIDGETVVASSMKAA